MRLTKPHKANSDHCDQTEMQGSMVKNRGKYKTYKQSMLIHGNSR